jgi:hypothetical protein
LRASHQLSLRLEDEFHTGYEDIDTVWEQLADALDLRASEEGQSKWLHYSRQRYRIYSAGPICTLS